MTEKFTSPYLRSQSAKTAAMAELKEEYGDSFIDFEEDVEELNEKALWDALVDAAFYSDAA